MFKEDNKLYNDWTSYIVSLFVFHAWDEPNNKYYKENRFLFLFACLWSVV